MSAGNVFRLWQESLVLWGEKLNLKSGEVLKFLPEKDDQGSINFGDGTTDLDVKIFLGTSAKYALFDVGNGRLTVVDSPIQLLTGTSCAAAARAVVLGGGTTSLPITSASTTAEFLEFRTKATAAAGNTARGMRMELTLSGGACGEAGRFVTITSANDVSGGTHGIHAALAFGTSAGNINTDTAAAALRGTVQVPARMLNGKVSPLYGEFYAEDTTSDLRVASVPAFLQFQLTGNATGMALIETNGYVLSIDGVASGAGKMFRSGLSAATINAATTAALKCAINGVVYYIPLATAVV